jgi:hypothetical protein
MTCNAWQASNSDGYFVVTGHWIEERTPTQWEIRSGLLGFTQLNNAHNGKRLGQALFKIIKWVGIEDKVCHFMLYITFVFVNTIQAGHVTCDNASNNLTMMREVAIWLKAATGKKYDWRARKIK